MSQLVICWNDIDSGEFGNDAPGPCANGLGLETCLYLEILSFFGSQSFGPKSQAPRNPNNQKLKYIPSHISSTKKTRMCEGINTWPPLKSTQYDSWYTIILRVHHSRTLAKFNEFVGSSQNLSLSLSFHLEEMVEMEGGNGRNGKVEGSTRNATFWLDFSVTSYHPGQKAAGACGAKESGGSHLVPWFVLKIRWGFGKIGCGCWTFL